jgi:hypothetical protein
LCVVCGIVLVLTATIFNSVSTSSSPVRTAIGLNAPVGTSRRSRGTGTRPVPPGTDVVWPSSAAYVTWRERQPFDQATKLGSPGTSSGGLTEGDRAVLAHWYFKVGRPLRLLLHLLNHPQNTHRPLQPAQRCAPISLFEPPSLCRYHRPTYVKSLTKVWADGRPAVSSRLDLERAPRLPSVLVFRD